MFQDRTPVNSEVVKRKNTLPVKKEGMPPAGPPVNDPARVNDGTARLNDASRLNEAPRPGAENPAAPPGPAAAARINEEAAINWARARLPDPQQLQHQQQINPAAYNNQVRGGFGLSQCDATELSSATYM